MKPTTSTDDDSPVRDPILLHVIEDAFVLVKGKNILEITFDGLQMSRKDMYEPPRDARLYEIYGVLGILEGIRAREKLDARTKVIHITEETDSEEDTENLSTDDSVKRPSSQIMNKSTSSTTFSSFVEPAQTSDENSIPTRPVMRRSNSLMTRFNFFGIKKKGEDGSKDYLTDENASDTGSKGKTSSQSSNSESQSADESSATLVNSEEIALEQRIVKQVTDMFNRSMFIFSYDFDITNNFQRAHDKSESPELTNDTSPWKQVDKRFWWNEHLSHDFISQNLDEWVLLVAQGAAQVERCEIEGYGFDFVLLSRRSRERAVPVFWSQSPYSLHPVPTLDRTEEENDAAFAAHFAEQEKIYGRQVAVSLTELSGREAVVGLQYRKHVEHLGDPNIKYVEFDFHRETKGMRFENISKLSTSLHHDMTKISQRGVFRTNCMDCLDRTNVVQSAFARNILNLQLMRFGISEYPDRGIRYYEQFERIFNNAWANNGDMISRMYAGTSALKGDFTRTGKRNITGIMNDASNSLARMYFNTVKDFWRQATVDYVLGYHKSEIFRHIPQSTQRSAEPGVEKRWAKIRSNAIEISSEIVIADDEVMITGWTLLSPTEPQKRYSKKFEEKVVLLTAKALYVCSYHYKFEKVMQFKRIGLDRIHKVHVGEYILSSLTPESSLADQNYGFLIYYQLDGELDRWNTGSIRNQSLGDLNIEGDEKPGYNGESDNHLSNSDDGDSNNSPDEDTAFVVFKAVRYNTLKELPENEVLNCREQVEKIIAQIVKACGRTMDIDDGFVKKEAIISLEQAEKMDGIFKKMGYKIKQAIWL
ncbi:hypothetical protein DFQ28_010625 [Apophysomyces sp. BC1034]|nr:hypothetical protein DFQ28_010625 [Apophysomyces sp. BC1034]